MPPLSESRRCSVLQGASEEAWIHGATQVTVTHLLLALLYEPGGLPAQFLRSQGVDSAGLRSELQPVARGSRPAVAQMTFAPEVLEICKLAAGEGSANPHPAVVLSWLLRSPSCPAGLASLDASSLRSRIRGTLSGAALTEVSMHGVSLGVTEESVLTCLGRPRSLRQLDNMPVWSYPHLVVIFLRERVCGLVSNVLQYQGRTVLRSGDPAVTAGEVLGIQHRVRLSPLESVSCLVLRGRVVQIQLGLDDPDVHQHSG